MFMCARIMLRCSTNTSTTTYKTLTVSTGESSTMHGVYQIIKYVRHKKKSPILIVFKTRILCLETADSVHVQQISL